MENIDAGVESYAGQESTANFRVFNEPLFQNNVCDRQALLLGGRSDSAQKTPRTSGKLPEDGSGLRPILVPNLPLLGSRCWLRSGNSLDRTPVPTVFHGLSVLMWQ